MIAEATEVASSCSKWETNGGDCIKLKNSFTEGPPRQRQGAKVRPKLFMGRMCYYYQRSNSENWSRSKWLLLLIASPIFRTKAFILPVIGCNEGDDVLHKLRTNNIAKLQLEEYSETNQGTHKRTSVVLVSCNQEKRPRTSWKKCYLTNFRAERWTPEIDGSGSTQLVSQAASIDWSSGHRSAVLGKTESDRKQKPNEAPGISRSRR